MQSRYFKQLLPLAAVALLILAFIVIEVERHAALVACEKQTEEKRRGPLATHPPEHLKEWEEMTDRARAIRDKYEDLFWRQPNVWSTGIGFFRDDSDNPLEVPDGEGDCKRIVGFIIWVTEKVDQSALPPEDRIPDVLEGVPVQILEQEALNPADFNFPAP